MMLSKDPGSFWYSDRTKNRGWLTSSWATPFSGLRWGIPAFCNFEGKAIYLDIDMIAMDDIAKLWHEPINGEAFCIAKDRKDILLHGCLTAPKRNNGCRRSIISSIDMASMLGSKRKFQPEWVQPFATGNWNCLDGEEYPSIRDPEIKIVHCTSIPTQPQLRYALKRLAETGGKHWSNQTPKTALAQGHHRSIRRVAGRGDRCRLSTGEISGCRNSESITADGCRGRDHGDGHGARGCGSRQAHRLWGWIAHSLGAVLATRCSATIRMLHRRARNERTISDGAITTKAIGSIIIRAMDDGFGI